MNRGRNKSSRGEPTVQEGSQFDRNTYWVKMDNGELVHVSAPSFMHAGPEATKVYKEKTGETLGFLDVGPGKNGCEDIVTFAKG